MLLTFLFLKDVFVTQHATDMKQLNIKIRGLLWEFEQRFQIFGELENDFNIFCPQFASDLPVNIQLEILKLQCDSDLKGKFARTHFYQFLLFP